MKVVASHTWNPRNGSSPHRAASSVARVLHASLNRASHNRPRSWFIALVLLIATGCASTRGPSAPLAPVDAASVSAFEIELLSAMDPWRDTPHRLGGNLPTGADCSGFVVSLFRDEFGIQLPRTSREQANVGELVRRSSLTTGDLVFFAPGRQVNHVGVYLSDGRFAHISTSRGFIISRLDEPYWNRRYHGARRVLDVPAIAESSPAPIPAIRPVARTTEPSAPSTLPNGRRGGW